MDRSSELVEVREAIASAERVIVLTGAGVSAESGVPTFRESDGLWARYDPGELATPEGFRRDPRRVWEWYELRRRAILACEPNPGHTAIAKLLEERQGAVLLTQNVDGLHQRGFATARCGTAILPTARILELHGNLLRTRCSRCSHRPQESDPAIPIPVDTTSVETLPRCPECEALLRPDVVWFGEALPTLDRAFDLAAHAEVCLVAGTSAVVHPAASLPLSTLEAGGIVIEVNPEMTPLTRIARWSVRGPSGRILPRILN